jgi:hypothetical protein
MLEKEASVASGCSFEARCDSLTEADGDGKLRACRSIETGHWPLLDMPFHAENRDKRKLNQRQPQGELRPQG